MFERILFRRSDLSRHRNGPYAKERERYLTLLIEEGRALPTLRQIANLLYHMAEQLPLNLPSVTPTQIEAAARQSDEPYVVLGVISPPATPQAVSSNSVRTQIYEDVDAGNERPDDLELYRGGPNGMLITVSLYEHDEGDPD